MTYLNLYLGMVLGDAGRNRRAPNVAPGGGDTHSMNPTLFKDRFERRDWISSKYMTRIRRGKNLFPAQQRGGLTPARVRGRAGCGPCRLVYSFFVFSSVLLRVWLGFRWFFIAFRLLRFVFSVLFFLLFIFPFLNIFFQIRENFKSEQILN
jgi:hypothetical protein